VTFPADYGAEQLAGRDAEFAVEVKEVRAKELPELDDDFAVDAAGFDSLDELREDVRSRLREAEERRIEADFREAALDAAVDDASIEVPEALVQARSRELWDRMLHQLGHQGITKETYLRIAGKSEEELLAEAGPDAERQLRREAVVAAVQEAEGIEATDDEVLEALAPSAQQEGTTPKKLLDRLRSAGRVEEVREDVRARKAVDLVAREATAISVEQAKARDKLWTPEKDEPREGAAAGAGRLWTPGS
jgi:trigger factor